MAENTLGKLLHLIAAGDSKELRLAALKVLGAVGAAGEGKVARTLLDVLKSPDEDLRISAIESLGQLHAEEALAALGNFVKQGGPELEAAVHSASQMGAKGSKLMGKIMNEVNPSLRSRMAAALAKSSTGNALVVTAQGLLDDDAKVIDATARSLAAEVPTYTPPQRHALAKFLLESLGAKKLPPQIGSSAAPGAVAAARSQSGGAILEARFAAVCCRRARGCAAGVGK